MSLHRSSRAERDPLVLTVLDGARCLGGHTASRRFTPSKSLIFSPYSMVSPTVVEKTASTSQSAAALGSNLLHGTRPGSVKVMVLCTSVQPAVVSRIISEGASDGAFGFRLQVPTACNQGQRFP
jgi:hypothetical protein